MRKVAVVASSDLWALPSIATEIAGVFMEMDRGDDWVLPPGKKSPPIVIVRADINNVVSSQVEELAVRLGKSMGLFPMIWPPEAGGRKQVYERDYKIVESVERVIAFFHPEQVMEGGTGHVVDAALAKGVPVEAWTLDENGELQCVGSDDGGYAVTEAGSQWLRQEWAVHHLEEMVAEIFAVERKVLGLPKPRPYSLLSRLKKSIGSRTGSTS